MTDDYSYVGVPAAIQEAMSKEDHDPRVDSSETHTFAGPEAPVAPKLSAPTVEWKSLLIPIGALVLATVLAVGHHTFNTWVSKDEIPITKIVVPQHWVTWIGVGFSFGFKSVVGVTMGFVLLQCLWLSVVRQPLTIKQIDTMYQIERQDQLYKTLPLALFFSPTIVIFSALTLLLPLSGVFAPGSLSVTPRNLTNISGPCWIPTGNLSAANTPDSTSLFTPDAGGLWGGVASRATNLATQCLAGQRIPDLPQVCGPDCRYNVSVPSFALQCTPNPSSLPFGQTGNPGPGVPMTLWNGTLDPDSPWAFYIAWQSNSLNGTSGNASCLLVEAQYVVEVKTKEGVQSVGTNITQNTSPIPQLATLLEGDHVSVSAVYFWMELVSIAFATQTLFLGNAFSDSLPTMPGNEPLIVLRDNRTAARPSFLEIPPESDRLMPEFIWGDVLKGIEEMSHNVTAALLTLQLGNISSECFFDQRDVIYQYSSVALWVPYGTALGIALISLVVALIIMGSNNTGQITTSFSNTIILTRNVGEEVSAGAKLRLKAGEDGKLQYILE